MASHNTTTTTLQYTGRAGHRPRYTPPKDHTPASFLFGDHLKLVPSIPPFSLSPHPSSQTLFPQTTSLQSWTFTTDTADSIHRDEPTRIQLHRQRLRELHANALFTNRFPGIKTSAAFFASLRTNLRLSVSPPPSPMSTPPSMRASASSLPPPSPLAAPTEELQADTSLPDDPLAGVPELRSYRAESENDKLAALKLVADSIAQMRQTANTHLISHPLLLAMLVPVLGLFAQVSLRYGRDWIMISIGCIGLLMAFFAACRFATQAYLNAAEDLKWEWLGDAEVLITKFGDEIIGTVIIDWISGEGRQKRKKAWRGEIKAWTVRLKYRHKGVGLALLDDAVQEAKTKNAESLEFAADHANSLRPLPQFFNKPLDARDLKARTLLQELFESTSTRGKRR